MVLFTVSAATAITSVAAIGASEDEPLTARLGTALQSMIDLSPVALAALGLVSVRRGEPVSWLPVVLLVLGVGSTHFGVPSAAAFLIVAGGTTLAVQSGRRLARGGGEMVAELAAATAAFQYAACAASVWECARSFVAAPDPLWHAMPWAVRLAWFVVVACALAPRRVVAVDGWWPRIYALSLVLLSGVPVFAQLAIGRNASAGLVSAGVSTEIPRSLPDSSTGLVLDERVDTHRVPSAAELRQTSPRVVTVVAADPSGPRPETVAWAEAESCAIESFVGSCTWEPSLTARLAQLFPLPIPVVCDMPIWR